MNNIAHEGIKGYLEAIPGVVAIDMDGMVTYVNGQCADYFGLPAGQILGRHIMDVFPQTKMLEGLARKGTEPELVFYNSSLGIGISIQLPLFKDGKQTGLLEYDVVQSSSKLYELSREYSRFLDRELLGIQNKIIKLEDSKYSINDIIGQSEGVRCLKEEIIAASKTNSTVIISGETGTGKELVAHAIHNLSQRRKKPIIKVNASALPENLVESELFGYESGSFTGASKEGRKGKFELADKGTLFIDEVNTMPRAVQPKILRVLQEQEVDRIGGEEAIPIDVRVITATNEDLADLVKKGKFRQDLYYRLNVIEIRIPPLRNRIEDLKALVMNRIRDLNEALGMDIEGVSDSAMRILEGYGWPGNVRELHNVVERAMNFAMGRVLTEKDLDLAMIRQADLQGTALPQPGAKGVDLIAEVRNSAERNLIITALAHFDNNRTKTAEYFNIARPVLYQKMKRLGIK